MTKVHARIVGDSAVMPRAEFEHLLELARRSEQIEIQMQEEELPALGIMRLAEEGRAFDWLAEEEDLYTVDDLKVRYR
ncbi:MAG: hypothetical protein HY320_05975 [Armatimonadetes bacterium]|nr:hypothetical protein [Armatimonadota bacterium]